MGVSSGKKENADLAARGLPPGCAGGMSAARIRGQVSVADHNGWSRLICKAFVGGSPVRIKALGGS
jgi:hypothetical protein